MKIKLSIIALCLLIIGCATIQPGNDPLVVRAEQTEAISLSTFDLVLNVDHANRPFWTTNAPAFHLFCEWLRAPQTVDLTNSMPRAAAMVKNLDNVKAAYNQSLASSNMLASALATLQSAVDQASAWLVITTNSPSR